jgi:hypothetical protein
MPNVKKDFLTNLTAGEMKKLLVARERIDVLMAEKEKLTIALDKIDTELGKLMSGSEKSASTPVKAVKKKSRRKTATRKAASKKTTKKKTTKKKVVKKAAVKRQAAKKTVKRGAVKKSGTASKSGSRVKLEDVVVKVIKANRGPINYKDLIDTIVKKKLFSTKSSNFDNVLRRTLSTSTLIKRVGRGIYAVA